tara:strand:+ start:44 stop:799 length:756 start_codon:yes stop_codon:yes gene_type:complete
MLNIKFFRLLRIGGWIDILNIKIFIKISNLLKKAEILEIGAHHGRSIIPILCANKSFKKATIIDIFSKQKYNISKSGHGNEKIFIDNLKKFNINIKKIQIIDDHSYKFLKQSKKKKLMSKFDLIHIDGGHAEKEVENDIKIAKKYAKKNSIIIIDDIFNLAFPEVLKAYLKNKDFFYPIFTTDQKLYASTNKKFAKKISELVIRDNEFNFKKINFFNKKTFYITEKNEFFKNSILQKYKLIKSLFFFKYHF